MTDSASPPSESSLRSKFAAVIAAPAPHLITFTICLLILLYGYEIFNFSLSIDEEVYTHENALWASIQQGRWTIGLLHRMLPPFGSLPMLSTLLFSLALGVSAYVLARVLFRSHAAQWAFVGIFVSFPIWPHIAEFNSLSWVVGIGCLMMTGALVLMFSRHWLSVVLAAALLAAAIGIYQTFIMWFLVLVCLRHLSVLLGTAPVDTATEQAKFPWLRSIFASLGGVLGYVAIEYLILAMFSLRLIYVQDFLRLTEYIRSPAQSIDYTLHRIWDLIGGGDPIYLGYGSVLMLLPLLGLITIAVLIIARRQMDNWRRLRAAATLGAALMLGLSPMIVAAGAIPPRAVITWIPVAAFLAGIALSYRSRLDKPLYVVLGAALFVAVWINVSLFYTDHLARERDELLTARVMVRVDQLLPNPPPDRIPFVVIGSQPHTYEVEPFHKVEVFGASFYTWDSNPVRIAAYLRILGIDKLQPLPESSIEQYRPKIDPLPVWPAAGSVALVDGILVLKLGPMAPG